MSRYRLIAAFILAPAAAAALVFPPWQSPGALGGLWLNIAAHTLLLGGPVGFLLHRWHRLHLPAILISAFLIGLAPSALWLLSLPQPSYYQAGTAVVIQDGQITATGAGFEFRELMVPALLGTLTGLIWWLLALAPANIRRQADPQGAPGSGT